MAQAITRLTILMDTLGITGKELAMGIGTDTTTISKWRNGQRKLKARSGYTKVICQYLLGKDFTFQRNRLLSLLKDNGYDTEVMTDGELEDALCVWMSEEEDSMYTSKSQKVAEDSSRIQVYSGYEGWKEAMNTFWEELYHMPPGQKVYIGDFGDVQWDLVMTDDIRFMLESIQKVVKAGHRVVIIDTMTDEYRPYVVILRWLPVYLSEYVEVRYIQRVAEEIYHKSIYVIENSIALSGMSIGEGNVSNVVMFHRDEQSVNFYQKVMGLIEINSRKLIYGSDLADPFHMVQIMEENFKTRQLTYMINHMPTFRNMPLELLEKILKDNQVEEAVQKLCLEANMKRREIRNRCNYIQIYNLDDIEAAVNKEFIIDYDLSRIVGRNVKIKKEFFCEYLQYLSEITTTDSYTMVLTSFKDLNLNADHSSISVQDDSIVIAWNAELYDRAIYCRELTVVGGYFQYLKEIWNRIPLISKNDKWTQKQFKRLLE